jgi:hypothetical protein
MQLYEIHTLGDSEKTVSGFKGYLNAPDLEETIEKLKTHGLHKHYISNGIFQGIEFKVYKDANNETASIYLKASWTENDTDNSSYLDIARVTISSVPSNCGAVFISALEVWNKRAGFGTFLVKEILDWCYFAGYTMVFCNTAGEYQNRVAGALFTKLGFEPMGKPYVNYRSENLNIWMQKILRVVEPSEDEDDEDNWDDVEPSEDDEPF